MHEVPEYMTQLHVSVLGEELSTTEHWQKAARFWTMFLHQDASLPFCMTCG